jgi:hypothetical protein
MKQITIAQAEHLALANKIRLRDEINWQQMDWIRENARYIADITMKRTNKTLCGEWPKGWKSEMIRMSSERAKTDLLARFLRDECKQLDGAIWLGNMQMIEQMEGQPA